MSTHANILNKFIFILFLSAVSSLSPTKAFAQEGVLTASNQWVFDRAQTYIYLTAVQSGLPTATTSVSHFDVNFSSSQNLYPSLNTFLILHRWDNWALWNSDDLGIWHRTAQLYDSQFQTPLSAESADFLAIPAKVGLNFSYEHYFLKPFIQARWGLYPYRINSSMAGAEKNGFGQSQEWALGFHLPTTEDLKLSFVAEVTWEQSITKDNLFKGQGTGAEMGLGWFF